MPISIKLLNSKILTESLTQGTINGVGVELVMPTALVDAMDNEQGGNDEFVVTALGKDNY